MTIYTYWGNKKEQEDGVSVLRVQSGEIPVGRSGDLTDVEYEYLSQDYIFVSGDIPWNRVDFPWIREDAPAVRVITVPNAPFEVSAVAENAAVSLAWAVPQNGGSPITGYIVTPYIGGAAQLPILTHSSTPIYNVTGLTNGTAYTFRVAAINAIGTGPDSNATFPVIPNAPVSLPSNTALPAISGTAQDSQTLSVSNGTWDNSPTTYAYQWQTSANGTAGWTNITGSISNTYAVATSDVGNYLRCAVTASNSAGNVTANSASTAQVIAASGTPPVIQTPPVIS